MASRISLFSSRSWVSAALCFLASDRILFRKASTGFSKAMAHVMPQRMRVEAAVVRK
jgi:hypothetical protein